MRIDAPRLCRPASIQRFTPFNALPSKEILVSSLVGIHSAIDAVPASVDGARGVFGRRFSGLAFIPIEHRLGGWRPAQPPLRKMVRSGEAKSVTRAAYVFYAP